MSEKIEIAFLWHMHQPDYRDRIRNEYALPWTYLHALKDYTDMAAHLERHPKVQAVVNFVPVLLDQIEDYVRQFKTGDFRDPLLRLLSRGDFSTLSVSERDHLVEQCFRNNHATMVAPFPQYKRLHDLYKSVADEPATAMGYLSGTFFADLLTWYHLSWTGESERRTSPLLAELFKKGGGYTHADRLSLLSYIGDTLRKLQDRYRALAQRGQIELSATPYTHPLTPLLFDFAAARDSQPDARLPRSLFYPGGRNRASAHIAQALSSHADRFGAKAVGMWPAEGAVSTPLLQLMANHGLRWTASSETVLTNSLRRARGTVEDRSSILYKPYQCTSAPGLNVFFRDEHLSDLIGFGYAKWQGKDAAAHFISQVEAIREKAPEGTAPLVCVFLDGENAWEHYPSNGYAFFEDLYVLLEDHPSIGTTTLSRYLQRNPNSATPLPELVAGSWVYGTLSTWIGNEDKNRAWDLLCDAKRAYDIVISSGRLAAEDMRDAEAQLALCESSDWFWWFGDYNPPQTVASFDALLRANLTALYRQLRLTPPDELANPIARDRGARVLEFADRGGQLRRAG